MWQLDERVDLFQLPWELRYKIQTDLWVMETRELVHEFYDATVTLINLTRRVTTATLDTKDARTCQDLILIVEAELITIHRKARKRRRDAKYPGKEFQTRVTQERTQMFGYTAYKASNISDTEFASFPHLA